VKEIESPAY